MVYQSQQILMPGALDIVGGALSKSEKMWDNSFSKILNSKMCSGERADIKNRSKDADTTKPLTTSSNNNLKNERQSTGISEDDKHDSNDELIKSKRDIEPMKRSDVSTEVTDDKSAVCAVESEVSHRDDLKHEEELQCALDEILDLLKKLLFFVEANENYSTDETASFPQLQANTQNAVELDMLRAELENMLYAANQLEGTKTSEIAVKFAKKLIELLDDADFAKMFEEISINPVSEQQNRLANLMGKMIDEAEKAKIDITSESISEIIIPVMDAQAAQQVNHSLNQPQIEASEEQQTELSAFKEQNVSNESTPEQTKKNLGNQWNETDETFVFTKPKEQKPTVSDLNPKTDTASFADIIKSEDIAPVGNIISKEPVDVRAFVVRQVIEKAETLMSENKKEVVMQLKPDSLGKITLRVIHERGEIVARFVAENDQVKSILESNMQMLRDSLQRNGVSVQSLSVSVGQQNTGQNAGDNPGWNNEPGTEKHTKATVFGIDAGHETYGLSGLTGNLFGSGDSEINLTA